MAAFAISRLIPGDEAQSMMTLQGINPEGPAADGEYRRLYKQLGLDKPAFYFSVVPEFYPDNINSILSPGLRNQTLSLLKQKCRSDDIRQYLAARDALVDDLKDRDSLPEDILHTLNFETGISALHNFHEAHKTSHSLISSGSWQTYISSFDQMVGNITNFYLPRLVWHGPSNQFHGWFSELVKGNLGLSAKDGRPALKKITSALGWTSVLVFFNILITLLIAVPSGLLAGYRKGGAFDRWSGVLWLALYSVPVFWLASLLIIFFTRETGSGWYRIFPVPGTWFINDTSGLSGFLYHNAGQLILPVICLVANDIAQLSKLVRDNVIQQMSQPYVLMAKAKGLSSRQVLTIHMLANALIPVITSVGGRIPASLSGALVVEVIFNIPGMGRLLFDSIRSADWNVVFGVVTVVSCFTVIFMLITDIVYALANPKIRLS